MKESLIYAYEFLAKGGIVMIPIGLCSLLSIVLFFERLIVYRKATKNTALKSIAILDALQNKHYERAHVLCDNDNSPLSALALKTLKSRDLSRETIQGYLENEASQQLARLERSLPMLGTIATISPLLGLLGTITGMIKIFGRVSDEFQQSGVADPGLLAGGIWEALITTAAGLCVAIPAFLGHRYLSGKLDLLILDLEQATTGFLDAIAPPPKANLLPSHANPLPAPQTVSSPAPQIPQELAPAPNPSQHTAP